MNNKIKLAVVPFLLALGACSSSSDTITTTPGGGTNIDIVTVSGSVMALNGTYLVACYVTGGGTGSAKEQLVVSGSSWIYTPSEYTSTDCTGTANTSTLSATISATATTSAITGWVDGQGATVTAPAAAGGSGLLSNNEAYTQIAATITVATGNFSSIPIGTNTSLFYIVDDTNTGAAPVLYRDDDADNNQKAGTADPYIKQPL